MFGMRRIVLKSRRNSFTLFLQSSNPSKKTPNNSSARSSTNHQMTYISSWLLPWPSQAPLLTFSSFWSVSISLLELERLAFSLFILIEVVTSNSMFLALAIFFQAMAASLLASATFFRISGAFTWGLATFTLSTTFLASFLTSNNFLFRSFFASLN